MQTILALLLINSLASLVTAAEPSGSQRVDSSPASSVPTPAVSRAPGAPGTSLLSAADIETAIRHSLGEGLAPGFNASSEGLIVSIEKHSTDALPPGHAEFPLAGAAKPSPLHPEARFLWRGRWLTSDQKSIPIWAIVHTYRLRTRMRLTAALTAGSVLTSGHLEAFRAPCSPFERSVDDSPANYLQHVLKQFAGSGTVLRESLVELVPDIHKDDIVPIEVVAGALHLKLKARAETDGRVGQMIPFVVPEGHRRFRARIQPDGSALVGAGPV